jgi:hypothetical protein
MEEKAAERLVKNLRRHGQGTREGQTQEVKLRADIRDGRIVFSGGLWECASIDLSVSSGARILAHWDGYCAAHSLKAAPVVGHWVPFLLGSRLTQYRGKVLKSTPLRTTVHFRYRHGGYATRALRTADLLSF